MGVWDSASAMTQIRINSLLKVLWRKPENPEKAHRDMGRRCTETPPCHSVMLLIHYHIQHICRTYILKINIQAHKSGDKVPQSLQYVFFKKWIQSALYIAWYWEYRDILFFWKSPHYRLGSLFVSAVKRRISSAWPNHVLDIKWSMHNMLKNELNYLLHISFTQIVYW